jgi:hypothetical protein
MRSAALNLDSSSKGSSAPRQGLRGIVAYLDASTEAARVKHLTLEHHNYVNKYCISQGYTRRLANVMSAKDAVYLGSWSLPCMLLTIPAMET